jgi:mRNA interferase ChpB
LVLSPREFNILAELVITCPITQGGERDRENGWAISLMGTGVKTQGVILASQIRTLDFTAHAYELIESLPPRVLDEVLARLEPLLGFRG